LTEEPDQAPATPTPTTCARCARTPRDADDGFEWVEIDGEDVCPGCLTLRDAEQLRSDNR